MNIAEKDMIQLTEAFKVYDAACKEFEDATGVRVCGPWSIQFARTDESEPPKEFGEVSFSHTSNIETNFYDGYYNGVKLTWGMRANNK